MYWSGKNTALTAVYLIRYGWMQFMRARLVEEVELLKSINAQGKRPEHEKAIKELVMDGVVDAVRICICFENFMKAKLLADGFIIHELDQNAEELKELARKQRKEPISLRNIEEVCGGWQRTPDGSGCLKGVRRQTLKLSCMLKPDYQKQIRLPLDVARSVDKFAAKRNELHLYLSDGLSTSTEAIASLEGMIAFAHGPMVTMHDSIIENHDLPQNLRLRHAHKVGVL